MLDHLTTLGKAAHAREFVASLARARFSQESLIEVCGPLISEGTLAATHCSRRRHIPVAQPVPPLSPASQTGA